MWRHKDNMKKSEEVDYLPEATEFQQKIEEYITLDQTPQTSKIDKGAEYIQPLIPLYLSRYVYHRCDDLKDVIEVYVKDIILNDFGLEDKEADTSEIEKINNMWNNNDNKIQLYYAVLEHSYTGYGALEIIEHKLHEQYEVQQIPAQTINGILVKRFTSEVTGKEYEFYFVDHRDNQGKQVLLKIVGYNYNLLEKYCPEDILEQIDYYNMNWCLWFGGCQEDMFYDIPRWESCSEKIYTNIAIKKMNLSKIRRGNVPAGVLLFEGPPVLPDPENPDEKRIDKYLDENLDQTDGGTMFAYLTTDNDERGITMQYQALTDNNYQYLENLEDANKRSIYKTYRVPPQRLMLMENKESMNSNQSEKILETYATHEVQPNQMFYKSPLNLFNRKFLKIKSNLSISTPEFVDSTATKIDTILKGWNNGLLTLGNTLELIADIYPQIDIQENIRDDDELLEMRFYNGHVLGDNTTDLMEQNKYNNVIDDLNSYLKDETNITMNHIT